MTSISNIQIELPLKTQKNKEKLIPARKKKIASKLKSLLNEYNTCLIIDITNIGSKQIAEMRKEFHGKARFLFGKNTLLRKIIRDYVKETKNKKLMGLMDLIKGNCGLVFTKNDICLTRKQLIKTKKQSSAKVASIAPCDVFLPVGPTNLQPTKTPMFQSMDIETRINKGQIDIIAETHLIKKGSKVGASEAILLAELNIKPFCYSITVQSIYENGNIINNCKWMDLNTNDISNSFYDGCKQISALCFSLEYPSIMNVPHDLLNAYKKTLGLGCMLETYSFDGLERVKLAIENAVNNIELDEPIINIDTDTDDDDTSTINGQNMFDPFKQSDSDDSSSDEDDTSDDSSTDD